MHKIKKLVCTLLAVCIISITLAQPVQALTGAEGAILGGGGALASISLTAPQVALLVAAGFGIVVAVENADKLAEGLTAALETAASGVDAGAETLAQWLEAAKKGSIAISSAPVWIAAAIKGWISGLYSAPPSVGDFVPAMTVNVGQEFPSVTPWGTTKHKLQSSNAGSINVAWAGMDTLATDGVSHRLTAYRVCWSTQHFKIYDGSSYTSTRYAVDIGGVLYYYLLSSYGETIEPGSTTDWGRDALAYVSTFPNYGELFRKNFPGSSVSYDRDSVAKCLIKEYLAGGFDSYGKSVCPDAKVGGIGAALEEGKSIDDVNMPDLDVAGSKSICPDGVLDGSIPIADTVADVIIGLTDGALSWSDYVSDVAVGTPSISVPVEGTETGVVDYPITDTGVSDVPIEETPDKPGDVEVPEGLAPYTVQLKDFFPFCIPFDIVDFVGVLCADPVAPSFDWTFTQFDGQKDTLTIDLAPFDEVAQLLRNMELLLFIIGLAFLTRNLIRG